MKILTCKYKKKNHTFHNKSVIGCLTNVIYSDIAAITGRINDYRPQPMNPSLNNHPTQLLLLQRNICVFMDVHIICSPGIWGESVNKPITR